MSQDKFENGVCAMADYKKMYYKAFNAITDAERMIETTAVMLRVAQQECEEIYNEGDTVPADDES